MTEFIPRLPDLRQPPDDPLHYLLNKDAGWRDAKLDAVELSPDGTLQLAPKSGTGRSLADDAGTFGGLTLPTGAAMAQDGSLYLLDAKMGQLKRFDPCECRFDAVPCTGGLGVAPRQVADPHGLAIRGNDLFICDTGNRRVQVFALQGMTLRAVWESPRAAQLPQTWQPFDIAFDSRGRAFVTDSANGVVHRFGRHGRWQMAFGALLQPTHLAIDRHDRVYVVGKDQDKISVFVFDADGNESGKADRPDKVADDFCPPSFATGDKGNLYLGDWCKSESPDAKCKCAPTGDEWVKGVFDLRGNPVQVKQREQAALLVFAEEGTYLSAPLDSEIYRCQWHRVVLEGDIPNGAAVTVETFTAETTLDAADLELLPDAAWRTQQIARALNAGAWDCLITSPAGRFLYLRLGFRSNGAVTPQLVRVKVFFPRISLRRYLPAVFGGDPISADFTDRLLAIFDTTHRSVEEKVDKFARYLDPMATPSARDPKTLLDFLTWLGSWMGLALDRSWDEPRRRRVLKQAHCLHRLRGTAEGLRRMLLIYLGWEPRPSCGHECAAPARASARRLSPPPASSRCGCHAPMPSLILEHFKLRRWFFVGGGRLGEQSVLWGKRIVNRTQLNETAQVGGTQLIDTGDPVRDPFHVYAHKFSVFIPAGCARTDAQRAKLKWLISLSKPAHTFAQLELVEPRFRIGIQSSIGFDSVVGRYPKGFAPDDHALGYDTVLSGPPGKEGGPALEIGEQSRIGTTTILG